jgi:hypothetical protein
MHMADKPTTTKKVDADAEIVAKAEELKQLMVDKGMSESEADARLWAVVPSHPTVVGNFADLQRLGGALVSESGKVADAFVEPAAHPTDEDLAAIPVTGFK